MKWASQCSILRSEHDHRSEWGIGIKVDALNGITYDRPVRLNNLPLRCLGKQGTVSVMRDGRKCIIQFLCRKSEHSV